MKPPARRGPTVWFLSIISMAWLAVIHGIAFYAFGVTFVAACVITASLAATFVGMLSYIAWEYRQAKPLDSAVVTGPEQDASLLMLTRSAYTPRHIRYRRTRSRLSGHHPVTDRIVSLHRPPYLDRRARKEQKQSAPTIESLFDYRKDSYRITPSAN